ncbi:ankyrin repeat domain-containing protein [Parachlamydia sp. AcF125]|uniref:ankyrin repeat domain-containing protein n=1 Tax=Parachlamydia sp. AcF125 TaxID=2795736 RepID=UPI001BC958CD|nr:ankyrin repeat domain-containing protein [Parachlamydia sp. AcF125]MBS4168055.1 hypothetical protein [Parachlamydia sp. AcF125]
MQVSTRFDYDPFYPVIHCDLIRNKLSTEIAKIEKEVYRLRGFIGAFDESMQEKAALTTDVMGAYLEVFKMPGEEKEIPEIREQIDAKIEEIRERCLENHRGTLAAREVVIIEGRNVEINAHTKPALEEAFLQRLEEKISQLKEEFPIDETTDLEQMCCQIEEKFRRHTEIFEKLFERKQALTGQGYEFQEALEPKLAALKAAKQELKKGLKVSNVFIACQLGVVDYLEQEVSKQWLWERKSFVNKISEVGFSLLHYAAYHDRPKVVQFLIQKGADVTARDKEGYLPLHWAAAQGSVKVVKLLLTRHPASIDAKGMFDRTPLHRAVFNGKNGAVNLLIKEGANLNAQTSEENHLQTPLHFAVLQGNMGMVATLTQYPHLDIRIADSQGRTPVHYAIENGVLSVLLLLLTHSSWQKVALHKDAVFLESLLKVVPKRNEEEIRAQLLLHFPQK